MPLLQSPTTWFAVNSCNDTSPSGVTDQVTGQPIYIGDLNRGVYFDLTNEEAAALSDTVSPLVKLYAGRYRRVQVDSGATAANVKTGTIGLMPSLAAMSQDVAPVGVPTENVVTSYDQPIGNTAGGVRPVVFLNAITPGNFGFVQELGIATVLGKSGLTAAAPAVGDVIVSTTSGLVDDPTQSGSPTYATLKTVLGQAVDLPVSNGLFRVALNLPTFQD
jgi:hypothetical protein